MSQKVVSNIRFEVNPDSNDPTALAAALAKSGLLISGLTEAGGVVTSQDSRVVTIKTKKKSK